MRGKERGKERGRELGVNLRDETAEMESRREGGEEMKGGEQIGHGWKEIKEEKEGGSEICEGEGEGEGEEEDEHEGDAWILDENQWSRQVGMNRTNNLLGIS